jgi:arginyl-tRNA--protein-N-Asp/Glu arginylyltransferase
MVNQIYPDSLTADELDNYLLNGWYRMGQRLFTVDYIFIERWIRVFWLRYRLKDFTFSKKQKELLAKNERFNWEVLPLNITEEHEALYEIYFKNIDFDASSTASGFLFGTDLFHEQQPNVFDSWMIELRDGEKLIAVGVFDLGQHSMSGILNFYHPDYKRFSPGRFLILKKMELAIHSELDWYYPGYIGYNFPKFDYKLFPGKETAEILDPFLRQWQVYSAESVELMTYNQQVFFGPFPEIEVS